MKETFQAHGFVLEICRNEDAIKTFIQSKAVPLQAWTGPESSRKLSFPDFRDKDTGWW